jgi:hypothetical protein
MRWRLRLEVGSRSRPTKEFAGATSSSRAMHVGQTDEADARQAQALKKMLELASSTFLK